MGHCKVKAAMEKQEIPQAHQHMFYVKEMDHHSSLPTFILHVTIVISQFHISHKQLQALTNPMSINSSINADMRRRVVVDRGPRHATAGYT